MENWKEIKDYEGIYQVSDRGQVRTVSGKTTVRMIDGHENIRHWKGRTLKQKTDKGGYKRVTLWKSRAGKQFLVHRLVCMAFHPNPDNLPDVNHIDGNPSNNSAENLEWITPKGNLIHAYENKLNKTPDPVMLRDPLTGKIQYFYSQSEASRFLGRNHGYIHQVLRRGESEVDGYELFTPPSK
jgi:hypothetical protein